MGRVRRSRALSELHGIWSDEVLATVIEVGLAARPPGLARAVAIGRYGRAPGRQKADMYTEKGRRFSAFSGASDGTAPPDRTGDLQSHNLAL